MIYKSFDFIADNVSRHCHFRGNTSATSAVIWVHGGLNDGISILDRVKPKTDLIELAPDALIWKNGSRHWIKTWRAEEPDLPDNTSYQTDYLMFQELILVAKAKWPTLTKFFICGYSAGAGMVFDIMHSGGIDVECYGAVKHYLNEVLFPETIVNPKPLFWWWATADDVAGDNPLFTSPEETMARLEKGYGCEGQVDEIKLRCCGKVLKIRKYQKQKAVFRPYTEVGAGHEWTRCRTCSIDDKFMEFCKIFSS